MKLYITIVFAFLTFNTFGQKTRLLQNINPRAKELKHYLNTTGDSLILNCDRTIYRVEIFNSSYGKALNVKETNVKVALQDIPTGRYVVEATLIDKLILITLLRNEPYNDEPELLIPTERIAEVTIDSKSKPLSKTLSVTKKSTIKTSPLSRVFSKKKETAIKITAVDKKVNTKAEIPRTSKIKITKVVDTKTLENGKSNAIKTNLANKKTEKPTRKIKKAYWLVYETHNRHSSQKIMRIADQQLVDKMIEKNKIDLRTIAGKSNILTVWEVYDITKFLKYKRRNRNALTEKSDTFNIVPYFKTKTNNNSLSSL